MTLGDCIKRVRTSKLGTREDRAFVADWVTGKGGDALATVEGAIAEIEQRIGEILKSAGVEAAPRVSAPVAVPQTQTPDIRFARQAAAVDPDADDDLVIGAHTMSKTGRRLEQWSEAMNAQGIAPTRELFNRTLKYFNEISKEFAPAKGKPTPQDRAAKRKENIRGRIASLRDRMRRGDYSETPKRAKFEMDEEELTLRFEESEAKKAYREFIEGHRRANSAFLNKTGDFLGQTIGLARDMKTGYDLSAAGRQGKKLGMKHPVLFAKAFARQLAALTSEKRAFKEQQRIANSKYVKNGVAHAAGLRLTDQNSQFEVRRDEHFGSRFDKFIPGVKASGRAYSTFLNSLRYDVFEIMVDAFGYTPARRKIIASMINIETGQGDISPKLASTYVHLNKIAFAPRLATSILQFLVNVPAWKAALQGDPELAARMVWEQAKTVAGLAAWYAMLGALLGALYDKERPKLGLNPLKKDEFLTYRFGDSRIDASAGIKQFMSFAAQFLSGRAVAKTGEEKDLRTTKFGARKIGDVGTQYIRSKLNPLVGGAYSAHTGFDFIGRPTTWTKEAIGLPMPMQAETAYELFRDQPDIRMAIALMLDSTIGDSVNSYSDDWKAKKPDLADLIEEKILGKKRAAAAVEE